MIDHITKLINEENQIQGKFDIFILFVINFIFCFSYIGLAYLTSTFFSKIGVFPSPFWPSASIAFVAMVLNPRYFAVGIFAGSVIANEIVGAVPLIVSCLVSVVNVIAAFCGTFIIKKYCKTKVPFYTSHDAIIFIFGLFLYSVLASAGGVLTGYLFGIISESKLLLTGRNWAISDAIGTIFLSPLILIYLHDLTEKYKNKVKNLAYEKISLIDRLERFIVFSISIITCSMVFFFVRDDYNSFLGSVYLIAPPLIWSAIRFSMKDAWFLYAIMGIIITVGTIQNYGPFRALDFHQKIMVIESIFLSLSLTLLIVGCLVSERRKMLIELKYINHNLEEVVQKRTEQFENLIDFQQHLMDSLPNSVFYKNNLGEYLGCNDAFEKLLFLKKEEIIGKTAIDVFEHLYKNSNEIAKTVKNTEENISKTGKPSKPIEIETVAFNGAITNFIYYKNPIYDTHQKLLGSIGVLIDISDRKKIETKLSESEQLFKIVAETAPFSLVMTRITDHRIIYANQRAFQIFGMTENMLGKAFATDFYAHPTERLNLVEKVLDNGFVRDVEIRFKRSDGELFWGLISATLIEYQNENIILVAVNNITQRKILEEKLRFLATIDGLTGIFNRRHFMELASQKFATMKKDIDTNLTVLMIDIDFFKRINDNYGHDIGDVAIKTMAQTTSKILREGDILGRLGGEEFAVILPNTTHKQALDFSEKIRYSVEALNIPIDENRQLKFTISIGVSCSTEHDLSVEQIISRADKALYFSKNNGRNQVKFIA